MDNEVDNDFKDIENKTESAPVKYLFVTILYLIVIILVVLLVLSIKNQKKVVSSNIEKGVIKSEK